MANRESYPASLFPLNGDLNAQAGATTVTVTGLQNIPVKAGTPVDGQVLTYVSVNSDWEPTTISTGSGFNQSIKVNSVSMSDDYAIFVNATGVTLNGSSI